MQIKLTQGRLELAAGKAYSLDGASAWSLDCHQGRVWLTVSGHTQDVTMRPGQRLVLPDDGTVVMESDQGAVLALTAPAAIAPRQAVRKARAGLPRTA